MIHTIEEYFNNKPNAIPFGKIYKPQSKPEYEDNIQKIYEEFDELRKKKFNFIKEYKCKNAKKNIVLNCLLIPKKSIQF